VSGGEFEAIAMNMERAVSVCGLNDARELSNAIPGLCPMSSYGMEDCLSVEVRPSQFMTQPEPTLEECDYGWYGGGSQRSYVSTVVVMMAVLLAIIM
jgi:hypothetical protein